MQEFTTEVQHRLGEIAARHGVSLDAAATLLRAVAAGGGGMAQFSHPELGGMGQWSPGMTMVGDMFNSGLRLRVEALCAELADLVREAPPAAQPRPGTGFGLQPGAWWPGDLGTPASSGGQNDMRYAYFPASHRLAVQQGTRLSLHDTQDHQIFGASQQQGGSQSLTFSSDRGAVRLEDLPRVDAEGVQAPAVRAPEPVVPQVAPAVAALPGQAPGGDPLALIERLADLHARGILGAEEFAAKKAELLGRL